MKFLFFLCSLALSVSLSAQTATDTLRVYFDFDSYEISDAAKQELTTLLGRLGNNPTAVSLLGHCDSKGSDAYNDRLSERRSVAVKNWFLQNGLEENSIRLVRGFGERRPLNSNSDETERSLNRRVEVIFSYNTPPPVTAPDTVRTFSRKTMENVKPGEKLVLPHINFQGGLHRFMPSALPSLKELLEVMKSYPGLEIEIQGHVCCRQGADIDGLDLETNEYNLSTTRAKAVYDYLFENGIEKSRMKYRGFGGKYPLVSPEITENDRTTNRRVEILILKL